MKELLDLILKNITTYPDDVSIIEAQEEGRTVYTISVNPEDMGRVIGKNGKVIKAIRSLAHVVAIRKDERYRINVAEVEGAPAPESQDEPPTTEAVVETVAVETVTETTAPADVQTDTVIPEVTTEVIEKDDTEDIISGAMKVSDEDITAEETKEAEEAPAKK